MIGTGFSGLTPFVYPKESPPKGRAFYQAGSNNQRAMDPLRRKENEHVSN